MCSENMSTQVSTVEDEVFPKFDTAVRKLIECPICMAIPLGPVLMCCRGHLVCNECRLRTTSCSLCRGIYSEARNYLVEALVEKSTLRCKYHEQGCQEIMTGEALVHHVQICDKRPIQCQYCSHHNLINVSEYLDHLVDTHSVYGTFDNKGTAIYDGNINGGLHEGVVIPYYFIDNEGHKFLLQMHVVNAMIIMAYVTYLGPTDNCKNFNVTIECHVFDISNNDLHAQLIEYQYQNNTYKHGYFFEWSGQPVSYHENFENDIFPQGHGLIIPGQIVYNGRQLAIHQSRWAYHVSISSNGPSSSSSSNMTTTTTNVDILKSSHRGSKRAKLTSYLSTVLKKVSNTFLVRHIQKDVRRDEHRMKMLKYVTIFGFGLTLAWAVTRKRR